MNKITVIIIDDEPLGRSLIKEFLGFHDDVTVTAECSNAQDAAAAIIEQRPDLIFLDINMPEINGFELLGMIDFMPFVIFSTAYDQYAVNAFEVNAVDYLLKPYDRERFDTALERVRTFIKQDRGAEKDNIRALLEQVAPRKYMQRILVKESSRMLLLDINDIVWAESVDDYVNLHTESGSYLVNYSLATLEQRLDPEKFLRVHRSSIVNLYCIKELRPWTNGRLLCRLSNDKEITISRAGAKKLRTMME